MLPVPGETAEQRSERLRDIPPIAHLGRRVHAGRPQQPRPGAGDELVLVIRGELLKKYPTAVIYAHRAAVARPTTSTPTRRRSAAWSTLTPAEEAEPPHEKVRHPAVDAKVEPDIYFFGFDLTDGGRDRRQRRARRDDPGWFFVLKERPGDPRFGLDIERDGPLQVWNDLAWPRRAAGRAADRDRRTSGSTRHPDADRSPRRRIRRRREADQYAEDRCPDLEHAG